MKKIFVFAAAVLGFYCSGVSAAYVETLQMNNSSFTASNDSYVSIASRTIPGGIFVGVVISSPSPGGVVRFFDSLGLVQSTIGVVSLGGGGLAAGYDSSANYIPFNVKISSGLTYSVTGNVSGITILYRKFPR